MAEFLISTISELGYIGVFALMFLETVFPPIPSELIVPFAGFAAARGELDIVLVILFATLGALAGATALYFVGSLISYQKLEGFVSRNSRWLTVTPEDLERSKSWFDKYSRSSVMIGRVIPTIRSLISLPAGVIRMKLPSFLFFTALGTAVWSSFLALSGYWLGQDYARIEHWLEPATRVIIVLIVGIYLYRLIFPKRRTKNKS